MGVAFLGFIACYSFFGAVVFPKEQAMISLPSGILAVSGGLEDNEFLPSAASATRHGDDDDVCFHYDGILLISYADKDGFATVFFFYVMNQLLYAEKHNLLPWIHLDNEANTHVYDKTEHNYVDSPLSLKLQVLNGLHWDSYDDSENSQTYEYPGTPILDHKDPESESSIVTLNGTGIWSSYFEAPSRLDPVRDLAGDPKSTSSTCHSKPIFQLTLRQIEPSLMVFCPYCVRAWRRKSTPPTLAQWNKPYQEWFEPMRRSAQGVVHRHIHPTEEMITLAHKSNPVVESEDACLALHIRHSDKADSREPIPVKDFLPYAEAYFQASIWIGTTIVVYVATDSNSVIKEIEDAWPKKLTTYIKFQKGEMGQPVLRSDNKTAVFKLSQEHHRTNSEIMVDILAMAKCEFMVHGMSAVSEAVHYMNPRLHDQSVNLEEETASGLNYLKETKTTMTSVDFGKMVRSRLNNKRRGADSDKANLDHSN